MPAANRLPWGTNIGIEDPLTLGAHLTRATVGIGCRQPGYSTPTSLRASLGNLLLTPRWRPLARKVIFLSRCLTLGLVLPLVRKWVRRGPLAVSSPSSRCRQLSLLWKQCLLNLTR